LKAYGFLGASIYDPRRPRPTQGCSAEEKIYDPSERILAKVVFFYSALGVYENH
jgi:hypothetical protein